MKLNETTNGKVRPDQVRMSNSMHVVSEKRRSAVGVLFIFGVVILVVVLLAGISFGQGTLGAYLGSIGHSPVPSALAAGTATLTETATLIATETVPAETVIATSTIAPATEKPAIETAKVTAIPTRQATSVPTITTPTLEPEDTPTLTAAEAVEATTIAPKVATAVAATLTAWPTPTASPTRDRAATATAEAKRISTAVAATLTAVAGGPVTATLHLETPEVRETVTVMRAAEACVNKTTYLADVTIPDNTRLQPGEVFTKTWSVKNSGTCAWDETYHVAYARHERMGAPALITMTQVISAGAATEISIPMVAPATPGTYTGVWQIADGAGVPFDDVLTVVIQVPGQAEGAALLDIKPVDVQFGYGIQAHMWDADMGQIVTAVHGLGFDWVKQQTTWSDMEPEKGNLQWGNTDRIVAALTASGLKPMFSVVKSPPWARPPATDLAVEGPPADPQQFADFLGAMAGRYKGKVKAYEVWNEQNLHYEWGNEELDPARYMTLLKLAYVAIKSADPDAVVISGALTPTGAPPPWAIDDYQYLEGMYQNGLKEACDAIGAHPSGYNVPPDADWQTWQREGLFFHGPVNNRHHSWSFRATMEGYRTIMLQYDDGQKTIWPTEFGWASSPLPVANYEYAADNSLEQQAQYTAQAYQMGKTWGWVGTMFLWNLNFKVVSPGSEMAQWGIIDENWDALPVYHALAAMAK